MGSSDHNLHVLFFPLLAQGHMLPMVDMAKLFASRGVDATILTTPANASLIRPTLVAANSSAAKHFRLHIVPFPSADSGLPEGCENLISIPSEDLVPNFMRAISLLRRPFDAALADLHPDFVVTDFFLPWTYDVAATHDVPRITFQGTNFFAMCAIDSLRLLPHLAEGDNVVLPGLPHRIQMHRSQFFDLDTANPKKAGMAEMWKHANEADAKSYGMLVNSFYELEPDYVVHYRKVLGRKGWHVGPVALSNQPSSTEELLRGGGEKGEECLKWLNGRKPGSVVYMCFGSIGVGGFSGSQLREMALGLEACRHPFIWALKNKENDWVPDGYEARIRDRGIVIRGWAPQLLILNHAVVGGFVTHCGWNSSLEGISAGLPMATWPLFADQFYNERFLVDVLGIGVAVGSMVLGMESAERPKVMASVVETAVRKLMGEGEEAERRRRRATELKEMARRAAAEGGSSYNDLGNLIEMMMMETKKKGA